MKSPTSSRNAKCILTLSGHTDRVNGCAFSPNGNLLITASDDKTVKVWDFYTGREVRTLTGPKDGVFDCAFSPDGSMILAPIKDKALMRWETETGLQYETLAGCWLGEVYFWEGKDYIKYVRKGQPIIAWAHFPDRCWIVTRWGLIGEQVRIWDANSGDEVATLIGHEGTVTECAFSPDFRLFASVSQDHSIRIWETDKWIEVVKFSGDPEFEHACNFSRDGKKLVSGVQTYPHLIINVWEIQNNMVLATMADEAPSFLTACTFSPDGSQLLTASSEDIIQVWDVDTRETIAIIDLSTEKLNGCIFSPDNRRIVSTSQSIYMRPPFGNVRVWEID